MPPVNCRALCIWKPISRQGIPLDNLEYPANVSYLLTLLIKEMEYRLQQMHEAGKI